MEVVKTWKSDCRVDKAFRCNNARNSMNCKLCCTGSTRYRIQVVGYAFPAEPSFTGVTLEELALLLVVSFDVAISASGSH